MGVGRGHIHIYTFYIQEKLKLDSNWHFRDSDFPYFKTERVLFTLPWRLFKDVYFLIRLNHIFIPAQVTVFYEYNFHVLYIFNTINCQCPAQNLTHS